MKQLSPDEKNFIFQIANRIRYPIVRLELRSSKERSLISTALNHVHLETKYDSMEMSNNVHPFYNLYVKKVS